MHQIRQLGQWSYTSKYDAVVTPLVLFVEVPLQCSSVKSERSLSQEVVSGWDGHALSFKSLRFLTHVSPNV